VTAASPNPAMPPWWAALPPVVAEVSCGEQTHRLRWAEGKLTAADHADAEGELVLAALGGDRSDCVDLVEAWGRHSDDLEVLAVGPRSAADELTLGPQDLAELRAPGLGWLAYAPLALRRRRARRLWPMWPPVRVPRGAARFGPPGATARMTAIRASSHVRFSRMSSVGRVAAGPAGTLPMRRRLMLDTAERERTRRTELLSLLALGPAFQWRLAGTVVAAWADGGSRAGDRDAARPALTAALAGRLAPAARAWLGIDPGTVDVSLHEDAGWGRLALSGDGRDRGLLAALPVGWLASVWAAGLAVTAGHLVVAVTDAAWPDATVLGVPEPGADPALLKVRATGKGWEGAS
jgi:hypothetical protein